MLTITGSPPGLAFPEALAVESGPGLVPDGTANATTSEPAAGHTTPAGSHDSGCDGSRFVAGTADTGTDRSAERESPLRAGPAAAGGTTTNPAASANTAPHDHKRRRTAPDRRDRRRR